MKKDSPIPWIQETLEDMKAVDPVVIDVKKLTSVTDYMVVCTGTSSRHVKAIADRLSLEAKQRLGQPAHSEGGELAEWVLVDVGDAVVHVMQATTRDYYQLEKLWQVA